HGFADRWQNAFTGVAHFLSDVDFRSFTFDRCAHDDFVFRFADEARFFLPFADHMNRKLRVLVTFADELHELLVDGIARIGQGLLILFGGITPLHDAEICGSGADIDHQGVQQGFQTISDRERFGDQHYTVGDAFHRATQVLPVDTKRLGGHTDNRANSGFAFAFVFYTTEP